MLIQFSEFPGMKPLSYQSCNNKTVQGLPGSKHSGVALKWPVAAAVSKYHEPVLLYFLTIRT